MTTYKVLAPLVQLKVRDDAGSLVFRQFHAGAMVPVSVDEDSLRHHLDGGLVVEEGDGLADTFAVPAGTPLPGQPPNTEVTEQSNTGQPVPPLSNEQLDAASGSRRTRRSASRPDATLSDGAKG